MPVEDMIATRRAADEIVSARSAGLTNSKMPARVVEKFGDFKAAINEINAASDQVQADLAELDAKRDYLLPAAYHKLRAQAKVEALERSQTAEKDAADHLTELTAELEYAAAPKVDPAREGLARGTFEAAVKNDDPLGSVLRLAGSANREAAGVIFTPHGQTILEGLGVDASETVAAARHVAAQAATKYGSTDELMAAEQLRDVGSLGAAIGASGMFLRSVAGDDA